MALAGDEAPAEIQEAARALRHVSVRCVNIGVGRPDITDKHWIYYPEETVFHRIFVQGNASPHCNLPVGFGFTCEITYSPSKPLPCEGDDLIRRCIDGCRCGRVHPGQDDPIWAANQVDLPVAYVVYDHDRAENVERIRAWLAVAQHHPGRTLQRVGVLQLGPRIHRRKEGGAASTRSGELRRSGAGCGAWAEDGRGEPGWLSAQFVGRSGERLVERGQQSSALATESAVDASVERLARTALAQQ